MRSRQSPVASRQVDIVEGIRSRRLSPCRPWGLPYLQVLAARMPGAARAYHRVDEELRFILFAAASGLGLQAWRRSLDRHRLARQLPLVWESPLKLPGRSASGGGSWVSELSRQGIRCSEGDHALYIPPQPGLTEKLGSFVAAYPADAGFKILKNPGSPDKARYLGDLRRITWIQSTLVGTAQDLAPVANRLYDLKLAPRLYDVAQLNVSSSKRTMFVVQHVDGCCPVEAECRAFLRELEQLVERKKVALARPDWRREPDFRCPGCFGNLLKSSRDQALYYIDFQDFLITDDRDCHGARRGEAVEVAFWETIRGLLMQHGIGVSGRLFLDLGCGAGIRLAQALSEGARWAVGWDQAEAIERTRKLLSHRGYTRCDLIGAELPERRPSPADIPAHLSPALDEAILFTSAVTRPIGLDTLAAMPWQTLIYEGGEGESLAVGSELSKELQRMTRSRFAAAVEIGGPVSGARPLALFVRRAAR